MTRIIAQVCRQGTNYSKQIQQESIWWLISNELSPRVPNSWRRHTILFHTNQMSVVKLTSKNRHRNVFYFYISALLVLNIETNLCPLFFLLSFVLNFFNFLKILILRIFIKSIPKHIDYVLCFILSPVLFCDILTVFLWIQVHMCMYTYSIF